MEHRVYALKLGRTGWKRRVARIEGATLRLEKPDGRVEYVVRQEDHVVAEPAETASVSGKTTEAAKLQDMLKVPGAPEELLKSMMAVTWLPEAGDEDVALICFRDPMLRDVWLRRTQDILAPGTALQDEVESLKTELRYARTDLERTTQTYLQATSHAMPLDSLSPDPESDVFALGYYPPQQHTAASFAARAPLPAAPALPPPPSASQWRPPPPAASVRTPAMTTPSSGRVVTTPAEPLEDHGIRSDAQAVVLQGLLAQLDTAERSAKENITRLQGLHSRFDRVATDAASWRLGSRLTSQEACSDAMRDIVLHT